MWRERKLGYIYPPFIPLQVPRSPQDRLSRHLFPVCYMPASSPTPQFCALSYALSIFSAFESDSNSVSVVCLQRISVGYWLIREPNKNHVDRTGQLGHKWGQKLEGVKDWGPLGDWEILLGGQVWLSRGGQVKVTRAVTLRRQTKPRNMAWWATQRMFYTLQQVRAINWHCYIQKQLLHHIKTYHEMKKSFTSLLTINVQNKATRLQITT